MYATIVSALLNPGLWMSARAGDCGHMLYAGAIVGLSLTALLAVFALIRAHRKLA